MTTDAVDRWELDEVPVPRKARYSAERWAALGVVLLLLAAVAAPQLFLRAQRAREKARVLPPPVRPPSSAGQYRGFAIQLNNSDPTLPYEDYIREIAQTGANTVMMVITAYQENTSSSAIFLEYRKFPSQTRLIGLMNLAHELGLKVVLMPIVLLENPGAGEWRGKINPSQPDKWWEDYNEYILYFAGIAQDHKAEVFVLGSELITLEKHEDRWRELIKRVRGVYRGALTYSSNWDHYEDIPWWDELDLVGMTSYYDLVGDKAPSLEVIEAKWREIRPKIHAWRQKVNRPLLFTEVGWPSQKGCAKAPWNYYGSKEPDPETQARCFEAFFNTWRDDPDVAGVLVWEWTNWPGGMGGTEDIGYVPRGKPAMEVIQSFFGCPGAATRPAGSAPASGPCPTTSAPGAPAAAAGNNAPTATAPSADDVTTPPVPVPLP